MLVQKFELKKIQELLEAYSLNNYKVNIFDELASTNSYALDHLSELDTNSVIVCEKQTAGRGRNGKEWRDTKDALSVSFVYTLLPEFNYDLLPLAIAIAVNRTYKQKRVTTKIKWPNDILLLDNTKVSGILLESKVLQGTRYIIIGIGAQNIQAWDKNDFLISLLKHVNDALNEYQLFGFALLRQEWLDNCIHYNKLISLYQGNNLLGSGIHIDLTSAGKIKIKNIQSHEIQEYSGSKISLIVEG